jgi:hypothetical protein
MLLADPDIGSVVKQSFEGDPRFSAGQRSAGAAVDPAPERDVLAGILSGRVEGGGVFEPARITVRGGLHDHHRGACGQVDSADVDRLPVHPEVALHRALVAQRLFDEVGDQAAVFA